MTFSFLFVRQKVQSALPVEQAETARFFETFTKDGIPQLLVLTDQRLNPNHKVSRDDVFIRYYTRTAEALSFVGQFFNFIEHGLHFAHIDDWNNIHVFVQDEFMSRAYGFKHNNIQALKTFLGTDVHIYPSKPHYRAQIQQAVANRLLLRKSGILESDLESVFKKQRGIFASIEELQRIDLDEMEQVFDATYDFDQSMQTYAINLKSVLVAQLTTSLQAEPAKKWTRIVAYAADIMRLELEVYHLSHKENNGESERVRLVLPDGTTDLKFYEQPSMKRWNKVVVEKSTSALSWLVIPYFLNSLHLTLTLRKASQQYLTQYKTPTSN